MLTNDEFLLEFFNSEAEDSSVDTTISPLTDMVAGKAYSRIMVSDYQMALQHESGWILLDTEAECCSDTWFAEVIKAKDIMGKTIKQVEELRLHECEVKDDGRGSQDVDLIYGYKLRAEDGSFCLITFRNSSNGYYGGSVSARERSLFSPLEHTDITLSKLWTNEE